MIKFIIKGLFRDPSRTIFPLMVIILGVFLTCLFEGYMNGMLAEMFDTNARLKTGHVKIMSHGYAALESQQPNDLALLGTKELVSTLNKNFPQVTWVSRIKFGGILDIPDEYGETKRQAPIMGIAIDFLNKSSANDVQILNVQSSLKVGHLPQKKGEVLLSHYLLTYFKARVGDKITLLSTSANGAMVATNVTIAGAVQFGIQAMDRNMMIADLSDIQYVLDMEDSVGEILGFLQNNVFDDVKTQVIKTAFNKNQVIIDDFSPVMLTMRDQDGLGKVIDLSQFMAHIIIIGFVTIMTIVIWNTRLIANLRRYGEIGVRLAIGESKKHIVLAMIIEAVVLGLCGAVIGTLLGLGALYLLQTYGIDISYATRVQSSMVVNNIIRGRISTVSYFIGFVPALCAPVLGTVMASIGIYKRETASLFKELEV